MASFYKFNLMRLAEKVGAHGAAAFFAGRAADGDANAAIACNAR